LKVFLHYRPYNFWNNYINDFMTGKFFLLVWGLTMICSLCFSQWTPNTSVNTKVCDTTGEQSVTKLALCPDGTTYYSWFDNRGGSYAVYLQRLDANGNLMFPSGGVLVSSQPQNSSLVDWDMIADNNNNAILTFTDIRNGGAINPFAYMISPAGAHMWGANGVTLSDSVNSFQPNPKVVQTSDGSYVFFWRIGTGPQKLAMQKLNASGVKQWGTGPVIWTSGTSENYDWPAMIPSDNGSVIVMFSGYTGSFISPSNYRIYSQKVSSTGTRVWNGTQDTVYSLGRVSGFYTPRLFSDGNSGAIYCWQDDRNAINRSNCYVQRKNSAGVIQFPVNGSAVSGNTANNRFAPQAAYMNATGETVAIFQEANSGQTQWGFYAQKFSANGSALWGSDGIAYQPLGTGQVGAYSVVTRDTNAVISYHQSIGSGNSETKVFRVGKSGGYVWPGNILTASSIASPKIRINSVIYPSNGMTVISWQDGRNDGGGVYAQNVQFDGTFGPLVGITQLSNEIPGRFELFQNFPNPFNPATKIRYMITESVNVKLEVYNTLGEKVAMPVNKKQNAGTYEVFFDGSGLPSGVYFYILEAGELSRTNKMMLIK
jgi:hypothetical protein